MKKLLALLLTLSMVFALSACGGSEEEEAAPADEGGETVEETSGGNLVGVAMPTKDLQRWNQDGENMKAQLEAAGYTVDLQYAANDIPTQVSQIENMIANGCEVLVIASIDGEALGTVLDQAKAADIPVISYDRLIMNSDAVSYYATFDNWNVGVKQGEYIVEALDLANAGDKTYNIEYITGDPGDNNINFFFDGAISVLQPYIDAGKLVVTSGQVDFETVATPAWKSETAQARMDNILSAYYPDALTGGTTLDICLCSNDSTALGVTNSLVSFGFTAENIPVITGQDCDIPNTKNMISGLQAMSVFKDTRTLADQTMKMVADILAGNTPETNATYDNGVMEVPSYNCTPVFADASNYKELLIDSGYYTEADLAE